MNIRNRRITQELRSAGRNFKLRIREAAGTFSPLKNNPFRQRFLATGLWLVLGHALLAADPVMPGDALFYLPTYDEPSTPAKWGYRYQDLHFKSSDGTNLHAWLIDQQGKQAKGLVVFSHGAAGSMGHHLGFATWFAKAGYKVLMYDYRGFGQSEGVVDRQGMVNDAKAAFAYVRKQPSLAKIPLISYGHSMGGAKSVAAVAGENVPGLRAVIVDSTFASYRDMARHMVGNWGESLVSDQLSPAQLIERISPTPLLIIHGRNDEIVPFSQGIKLYEAAKQPKTMFDVKSGKHGDSLSRDQGAYRKRLLQWLDSVLDR